ncbi:uncharacterized protein [Aquarana catesbeiana]|uniref:uncharacterized protein n=1 Tax=Aquarana catesbeiana TaxID=8400 RepID=UPI003CCA570A
MVDSVTYADLQFKPGTVFKGSSGARKKSRNPVDPEEVDGDLPATTCRDIQIMKVIIAALSLLCLILLMVIGITYCGSPFQPFPVQIPGERSMMEEETEMNNTSSGSPFQPHPTRTPAERNKLEEEIWMNNLNPDSFHLCPPDWFYIYKKCYYFSETKKSYKEKNSFGCRLASIPNTLIFLRRLIAVMDQEFWVGVDTMDQHQSSETKMGRWRDGSMEELLEGVGSCIKLGRHLKLENCFLELRWICEKDAAEATQDLIL